MSIKNRDGTIFKLRGPNPAMNNQDIWGDYVIHNMKFVGKTVADPDLAVVSSPQAQAVQDDFAAELEETKVKPEPKPEPQPEVKIEVPKPEPISLPKGTKKVDVHCLPATLRERKDGIHGDKYQTIQYGSPFVFEAVILQEEDFFIRFWTNVSQVSRGSVVFPKIEEVRRWWRVSERQEKGNGWILTAVVSDYTPSFGAA